MAVMIYFVTASLRIVTENASKKVNVYFLSKLKEYDSDFKEKMNKLEELRESKEEVEQRIKVLKQDYNAMQVSRFYKPRPVIRDAYIPVSHYIDNGFFADYKIAKNLLVMDKRKIIRTVLDKFPYQGNLERYNAANSILKLLNFNAVYDLCTMEKIEQLKVLNETLKKKERALLGEFIEPMDELEEFDILDFISWLKQTVSIQTPVLTAYLGEEDENYDDVADNVVCMYDKNVCEGIRIVYQGRLYDYSIYKSRKKNEHIY
ncbi:MAG: hypothetical protein IKZ94_00675 [Lachnospiraceae bacterium]|nr:hypothetical protein [Lachnospiraceae bacterium]